MYYDIKELIDVFEARTVTGSGIQLILGCSDLNQSVGKPLF